MSQDPKYHCLYTMDRLSGTLTSGSADAFTGASSSTSSIILRDSVTYDVTRLLYGES